MTSIVFYEKPGCAGNRRQKQLLQAAGFELQVRDLLAEPWSREQLRGFFAGRPVAEAPDAALVREDGAFAYAIVGQIPIMLIDEAIPLARLA